MRNVSKLLWPVMILSLAVCAGAALTVSCPVPDTGLVSGTGTGTNNNGGTGTNDNGTGTNNNVTGNQTGSGTNNNTGTGYSGGTSTVTFNSNGGSGTVASQTANAGSSITLPGGSGLIRIGFVFTGWNTNAAGTGTSYEAGSSYPVSGNATLYAQWEDGSAAYTVTFSANGGDGAAPSHQIVTTGTAITLPNGNALSRTGFTFGGWNTQANGTGTNYNAGDSYTVTGPVTLYARWVYTDTGNPTGTGSNNPVPIEMVFVPGGSFQMGTASGGDIDERPVHTVTLTGFSIGKYEVTQGQYQAVMGSNPASSYGYGVEANYPVYHVSWYDAVEFCNALSQREGLTSYYTINKNQTDPNNNSSYDSYKWLVTTNTSATGYRLPTEAQWEYAAKGGNGSPGNYTYSGSNTAADVAWYDSNGGSGSKEVGTKAVNGLGIYDMSGNVCEWCWDWYSSSYYSNSPANDPQGASSGSFRVERGGYWSSLAGDVRSANRGSLVPNYQNYVVGFRLVRPAQ